MREDVLDVRFSSLRLPHTSQIFSFDSSGTAMTTRWPFGLRMLPATLVLAPIIVVTRRNDGNACTTTELAMREGVKSLGSVLMSVWFGWSVDILPGPWVLSISLQ